ncbi:MAG: hypothetical protein WCS75_01445 [Sphingomonas sp.]|jgi:hypothetical protein|uniref:hypothetical protein n=1 Tax=Sphingomonas sp. TaxID=28214 RepID=UPI0035642101
MLIAVGILLIGVQAAAVDTVTACHDAVHSALNTAPSVCVDPEPKVDITSSKPGLSPICVSALAAGRQAGKFGPGLPEQMRNGLIREFDKKEAACQAPAPPPTKERRIVQLWD